MVEAAQPDFLTHGFCVGHATHPNWRAALVLAAAPLKAALFNRQQPSRASASAPKGQRPRAAQAHPVPPMTLGFVYFTDHYAADAPALLAALRDQFPGLSWVGCVGLGVAALGIEYIDEPALVLMLAPLQPGSFEVFSGTKKLQQIDPFSALVHADGNTPDLAELLLELSQRTTSGYLFGGLAASRHTNPQLADGVWQGGLSGVAFDPSVKLISRVTQGCQPLGPTRTVTKSDRNLVLQLDGEPALPALMKDLGASTVAQLGSMLPRLRTTLAGLTDPADERASARPFFGADMRVRHLVGLDPARQAVAVADTVASGQRLVFCERNAQAARRDLVRVCSEIRDELESAEGGATPIRGAVYISCAGRGGAHFGGPSAELKIVQHALGAAEGQDIPMVGFFAGGEIARHHIYGYTGVLTVFTGAAA